jgi:predicted alpha/beta hydrolase family esterase
MMDEVVGSEKIAIAHSLGCMNWMLAAMTGKFEMPFDRVLFVAPPDPIKTDEAEGIRGEPMDLHHPDLLPAIRANTKSFTIMSSDNDRWLPRGIKIYEEALQQKAVVRPGAGHFSLDDGWGTWPGLLSWIESGNDEDLLR